jgi:hypothetical protein
MWKLKIPFAAKLAGRRKRGILWSSGRLLFFLKSGIQNNKGSKLHPMINLASVETIIVFIRKSEL